MLDIYLPIAEVSLDVFLLLGIGAAVGFLSGVFGVGGGFLLDPALDLHRRAAGRRGRLLGQPARRRLGVGRDRPLAARQRRLQDGLHPAARRLAGSVVGVWVFTWLKRLGQVELMISLLYVVLLGLLGMLMAIESARALLRQRRPGGYAPQAAPAQLAARPAAEDALPQLEALYQRAAADRARLRRRHA